MAIKMEDLKPILEPLLSDENSADIIEKIKAVDKDEDTNIDELVKAEVDKVNASWNQRFRDTFLNGTNSTDPDPEPNTNTQEEPDEEDDEDLTYDALFDEGGNNDE